MRRATLPFWLTCCIIAAVTRTSAAEAPGWPDGWARFWSRDSGAGQAVVERSATEGKPPVFRIEHTGPGDWSLGRDERIRVQPGDRFVLSARVKVKGEGSATLGVILYGRDGKALDWAYGGRTVSGTHDWQTVRTRFAVSYDAAAILPRVIGSGPATVWVDSFGIERDGRIDAMVSRYVAPEKLTVENPRLAVTFSRSDGRITVVGKPGGRTWTQHAGARRLVFVTAKANGRRITFQWLDPERGLDGRGEIALDEQSPELTVTLSAEGSLARTLTYPLPFTADALAPKGKAADGRQPPYLVIPMNEGISYPVDDEAIRPRRLIAYGGHGICMGFWGVTDGEAGHLAILETPDDAAIRITRADGRLVVVPEWDAQKGAFGYPRRLRYVFFERGGHVAICKRYREYAKATGILRTLSEKRAACPAVDRLVGAVNTWCWDKDAVGIVREMQEAGIDRILWSHRSPAEQVKAMNAMPGVLTSRYDIYQDVMNPENFQYLRGRHGDWPTEMWPDGLNLDARGQWRRGWRVRGKDGTMYPCGVVCDRLAPDLARKRIGEELKNTPYRSRFIDTTTASPWRECYHPDHPLTRTESRKAKMDLLRVVSGEFNLVCGSETGHEAAVPVAHYFEGMLSLGPYRVPDAGRDMARIWDEVPERVATFQLGHRYRLPLWELVYHDCVVAQWYWGDYNNKLPSLWDKRDLFNALYGTPPMFMFRRDFWRANRDRFVASYRATCPVARATGYREMTDHRFLTPDRDVQQTRFAGGVTVTVNFGTKSYRLPDGTEVRPMTRHATGLP